MLLGSTLCHLMELLRSETCNPLVIAFHILFSIPHSVRPVFLCVVVELGVDQALQKDCDIT